MKKSIPVNGAGWEVLGIVAIYLILVLGIAIGGLELLRHYPAPLRHPVVERTR